MAQINENNKIAKKERSLATVISLGTGKAPFEKRTIKKTGLFILNKVLELFNPFFQISSKLC
jgi:hypothetical protein